MARYSIVAGRARASASGQIAMGKRYAHTERVRKLSHGVVHMALLPRPNGDPGHSSRDNSASSSERNGRASPSSVVNRASVVLCGFVFTSLSVIPYVHMGASVVLCGFVFTSLSVI